MIEWSRQNIVADFVRKCCSLLGIHQKELAAAMGGLDKNKLSRLVHGVAAEAKWSISLLEKALLFLGPPLGFPAAEAMQFLLERRCKPQNEIRFREILACSVVLPRPNYGADLERKLLEYETTARSLLSFQRAWPVSQVNTEYSMSVERVKTRPVGLVHTRALGSFHTFIRTRRSDFQKGQIFPMVTAHEQFVLDDAMQDMRFHRQEFSGLTDEVYDQSLDDVIDDCITDRSIAIGVVNNAQARLPDWIKTYLNRFDGILLINHEFVMLKFRNQLVRSFCKRTPVPSACNEHLDFICGLFNDLRRYLPDGHLSNPDAMTAALNEYRCD